MAQIKVLVIDDSAVMRQLLSHLLTQDPALEVVGVAADPYIAWRKIQSLRPDVLTLDVEMPRMDGVTFLEKLMRAAPLPVVLVSSLTQNGAETTLRALELGAVDFVSKPILDVQRGVLELADEIIDKVKAAARARIRHPRQEILSPPTLVANGALLKNTHKVIAVGASTGGTEALRCFLTALPVDAPGVVIVQHMPEKFTHSFAERLNNLCRLHVSEARNGDRILPGRALIAPGNYHMKVMRSGAHYYVQITQGEPVNRHRPSVDVLFHSCAQTLGKNAVGIIMTGMGNDGAQGLLAMRHSGARTIAQDESSCTVFGMPREAIALGAAEVVVTLDDIPTTVLRLATAAEPEKPRVPPGLALDTV